MCRLCANAELKPQVSTQAATTQPQPPEPAVAVVRALIPSAPTSPSFSSSLSFLDTDSDLLSIGGLMGGQMSTVSGAATFHSVTLIAVIAICVYGAAVIFYDRCHQSIHLLADIVLRVMWILAIIYCSDFGSPSSLRVQCADVTHLPQHACGVQLSFMITDSFSVFMNKFLTLFVLMFQA